MGPGNKLSGQVEADETYIGGKARNMHPHERARKITGTGPLNPKGVRRILVGRRWLRCSGRRTRKSSAN
jgi:hypothetical protein